MLFIAFEKDHVVPPKPIRHNVEKYSRSKAITASLAWALDPTEEEIDDRIHLAGVRRAAEHA